MQRRDFLATSMGFFLVIKGLLRGEEPFKTRDPFMPMIPSPGSLVERLASDQELTKEGLSSGEIRSFFSRKEFRYEPKVIERFLDNPEKQGDKGKLSYEGYRRVHNISDLIDRGPVFFKDNIDALLGAKQEYGVDSGYIAAILGVESSYGKNKGVYTAFNALSSIYAEPENRLGLRRKNWAYNQLKSLIIFAKKSELDVFSIKSSYAGAVSAAQFIPDSLRHYYVGKNGDFKADINNIEDAIYSIAYYLKKRGEWNKEEEKRIPKPGSDNWKALFRYNPSNMYVRLVVELATKTKWKSLIKPAHQVFDEQKRIGF